MMDRKRQADKILDIAMSVLSGAAFIVLLVYLASRPARWDLVLLGLTGAVAGLLGFGSNLLLPGKSAR